MLRLSNGVAWIVTLESQLGDVWLFRDGAARPQRLTWCDCVFAMGGGNDTLVWIQRGAPDTDGSLWIARAPRWEPQQVWRPNRGLFHLATDPTNPKHLVVTGADGDAVCPEHGDIYFIDTDTIATTPPRALTSDQATQMYPVIRGDRVLWTDFSSDRLNPNGCPDDAHSSWTFVLGSLSSPSRRVIYDSPYPMTAKFLGPDRAYFMQHSAFGYVLF